MASDADFVAGSRAMACWYAFRAVSVGREAGAQGNSFACAHGRSMLTFLENDFTTRGAFAHFDIPTAEGGLELEKTSEALKLRLTLRAVLHHKCCKEGCTAVLALQKCFFLQYLK